MALILKSTFNTSETRSFVACSTCQCGFLCGVRFHKLPQVRCALWQAKHARRAFFLRGREGSLGLLFGGGLDSGPVRAGLISSVEARSIFSSAMMLELSRSTPGPGEGEPSSASGDILKAGYDGMAERAARCTSTKCDVQTAWRAAHGQGMCSHLQVDVSIWATRGPGIEAVEPAVGSGAGCVIVNYCALTTTALSSVRSHARCRAARDGGVTKATGLERMQRAARPIAVCAAVVSRSLLAGSLGWIEWMSRRGATNAMGGGAADQPGSRECLGTAGGREGVEEVVVGVVIRQSRGEAFGACDGSGWRMGRRSGACVDVWRELCDTRYQS